MSQTQLASMFIGNPQSIDREERLRGVTSKLDATIHIVDGQSHGGKILDIITARNIISDAHKKSLEDTLETYDFITFADKRFSAFLEKRNRIIIPDEDHTLREFVVFEVDRYKDSEGYKSQVYSHASYLELKKATVLYPDSYKGTASQHAGRTLNDTGWQVGLVEVSGDKTLSRDKHTNPYEFLKRIAKEFGAELRFRIEHDGNKVIGRYVDLLQRVGAWRGREVEFGKDLGGIRRIEKQNIVTALLGLGPEREDGTRIEVLVEDEDALKRWGRIDEHGKLHHLIETYEIQSERQEMTLTEARQYTRTALNKRINESVTYECTIIDLENVPGMENKKIRHGDTIRIKDTHFNPPLYLEARVFEFDRSIKTQAKKDIKLGDFTEFTEEEVNATWEMLRKEIRKKIDIDTLRDYAEPKKIESDTPPEIKEGENPIWVDTSTDIKTPHVVVGEQWVKMSPTERDLSDADRLKTGIIDVGAVPLRTSKTGASIDWDGVNGLVQRNRDGNPVSWLDFDGNAHFENGFFGGRIEALEGFFGDNIRLRDGKMEIVRPDGAISMSDGMVDTGYTVVGNDPMYMTSGDAAGNPFEAFSPGGITNPEGRTAFHIYSGSKGSLDGRGTKDMDGYYADVRDKMSAVVFQKYHYVHSARYLVFKFRKYAGAKYSVHVMKNQSADVDKDRLYFELFEKDVSGLKTLVVDIGNPDFEVKTVSFKIGWTQGWGPREESIRFIMEGQYLTDFID